MRLKRVGKGIVAKYTLKRMVNRVVFGTFNPVLFVISNQIVCKSARCQAIIS